MNVDKRDWDPRELLVQDELESRLTDDESEEQLIRDKLAQIAKEHKELEFKLQQQLIAKSQHVSQPLLKPTYFQNSKPIPVTGNAIIDKLNVSKRQQQVREQHQIQLHKSRVYTFDDSDLEYKIIECNEIDKYSGKRLVQRYIPSSELDKFFQDKKILRLDKLFAKVTPPNFKEPDYFNWCVIGVITSKSEPMFTAQKKSSKFMKLTISDFQLSIDLTLLDQLFNKYWKLKIGDLVAILNPQIWINRTKKFSTNVNAFSLTLKHDFNSILEIGKLDIKYCQTHKRNGTRCGNIISQQDTYCYFHQELLFKKTTSKRMELNGSYKMYDPVDNGVKQQILYATHLDNTLKGNLFNDPHAVKTDRFTQLLKLFSNTLLLKLFFNDDLRNLKENYKRGGSEKISKKRKLVEVDEPKLTELDRQKLIRQKLKLNIIKHDLSNSDDELDIIF